VQSFALLKGATLETVARLAQAPRVVKEAADRDLGDGKRRLAANQASVMVLGMPAGCDRCAIGAERA